MRHLQAVLQQYWCGSIRKRTRHGQETSTRIRKTSDSAQAERLCKHWWAVGDSSRTTVSLQSLHSRYTRCKPTSKFAVPLPFSTSPISSQLSTFICHVKSPWDFQILAIIRANEPEPPTVSQANATPTTQKAYLL